MVLLRKCAILVAKEAVRAKAQKNDATTSKRATVRAKAQKNDAAATGKRANMAGKVKSNGTV